MPGPVSDSYEGPGDEMPSLPSWALPQLANAEQAILSTFAANLAALRRERGLTLRQLGRLAGVNHETIRRAETGADLTLGHAARLAYGLGVSLADLVGRRSPA